MESKVVFVDGLNVYTPSTNAPDWVKADMVLNPTKLIKWLQENDQYLKKESMVLRFDFRSSSQRKVNSTLQLTPTSRS
jgi:hypothetical protein